MPRRNKHRQIKRADEDPHARDAYWAEWAAAHPPRCPPLRTARMVPDDRRDEEIDFEAAMNGQRRDTA